MIGGAIAYQYARTGTLGTLTHAQMQAVINDQAFGMGAQSITPSTQQTALEATATSQSAGAQAPSESLRLLAGPVQSDAPSANALKDVVPQSGLPLLLEPAYTVGGELHDAPVAKVAARVAGDTVQAPPTQDLYRPAVRALLSPSGGADIGAPGALAASAGPGDSAGASTTEDGEAARIPNETPGTPGTLGPARDESRQTDNAFEASLIWGARLARIESDDLLTQWFERGSQNDDLTLLDEILRGESGVTLARSGAVAAEWRRSHGWLGRSPRLNDGMGDSDESGIDLAGWAAPTINSREFDPSGLGLRGVSGHAMKPFTGLQDGFRVFGQA